MKNSWKNLKRTEIGKNGGIKMDARKTLKTACEKVSSNDSLYGTKKESFLLISKLASLISGKELTPKDCCNVLIALKLSRERNLHKDDNMIDLCGYAAIKNELEEQK